MIVRIPMTLLCLLLLCSCFAQEHKVLLKVDMSALNNTKEVGVIGNIKPLSLEKEYKLTDENGDGIYEATIVFNTSKKRVRFKFTVNGEEELAGSDQRTVWFNDIKDNTYVFNEFDYYSSEQLEKLTYTESQIIEDVDVLSRTIQYIHPNIYRYRDSLTLQSDFEELQQAMLEEPTMVNAYKQVSKLLANIKCGHTFTNPWNQGVNVKRAIFHQPNKIPITFKRLGYSLFVDKEGSNKINNVSGYQILSINGVPTEEILKRLSVYITSDGNNYEKKLERLALTGTEKFSLFDIFYPLEFGNPEEFKIKLRNPISSEMLDFTLETTTKTNRTRVLKQRYGELETKFDDGWKFKIYNDETAILSIKSFAVEGKNFDWKKFLKNSFNQLQERSISNFIIDIRGNEGGQTEPVEYILERLVKKPLSISAMESSVRYLKIPDEFRKYISTWDNVPYNWSNKVKSKAHNERYFLKDKYSLKANTYEPVSDGFRGKTYLLTDAANSSATHLMATYAKKIDGITLVGQETGGSTNGINAGYIFFLRLPHTKVEIDIGVISQFIPDGEKDTYGGGIKPDININQTVEAYANNRDEVLEYVFSLIDK